MEEYNFLCLRRAYGTISLLSGSGPQGQETLMSQSPKWFFARKQVLNIMVTLKLSKFNCYRITQAPQFDEFSGFLRGCKMYSAPSI